VNIDLSHNRYIGAWLAATDCSVIGGKCGYIGGVTDEKYAIGIQCDSLRPVVYGVQFDEIYFQSGYIGSSAGEGLPVNFAATSSDGRMERCVAINSIPQVNSYGIFCGIGGSHIVKDNQFVNFWRACNHASSGDPEITGNVCIISENIDGSNGIACDVGLINKNICVGYERPYSEGKFNGNIAVFYPENLATEPQPDPDPYPTGTGSVLSIIHDTNFGNIGTKTAKIRVPVSEMTPPSNDVTKIRFKLSGNPTESISISKVFVGPAAVSGDVWDAMTLNQLKFGGVNSVTVPSSGDVWSDWLDIIWDKTSDLIISAYCSDTTGNSDALYSSNQVSGASTSISTSDLASTANASGLTSYSGYLSLITEIETDGF
jgi:hypothetical protein